MREEPLGTGILRGGAEDDDDDIPTLVSPARVSM